LTNEKKYAIIYASYIIKKKSSEEAEASQKDEASAEARSK